MNNKKYDVFISYRRDGGESTAKMLRDQLVSLNYRVFFDVESLRSGDFNVALFSVIEECRDFLLVLSPGALDRCENENDWVRLEIEHALGNNLNVVPIMLRRFTFPEKLPQSIEPIRYKNGLEANYQFFDAFIQRLQSFLLSRPVQIPGRKLYMAGGCAAAGIMVAAVLIFSVLRRTDNHIPVPVPTLPPAWESAVPTQTPPSAAQGTSSSAQAGVTDIPPAQTDKSDKFNDWNDLMADVVSEKDNKWVLGKEGLERTSISTITFLSTLADMPEDAWNVSFRKDTDAPVMAWVIPIDTDVGAERYALYIATDGNIGAKSCEALFAYYEHLTQINFNHCFYTGQSDSMARMFYGCKGLQGIDLIDFCTENVTDMSDMFNGCGKLASLDCSAFCTEKVINTKGMFADCMGLKQLMLSGFRTEKVKNMSHMFSCCSSLTELDLSGFRSEQAEDTSYMFYNCSSLTELNLSDFRAQKVNNMQCMFTKCGSLTELDLHTFTTDQTTNMTSLFADCVSLAKLDISKFSTDNVTEMSFMFNYCNALTEIELSHFKTENVERMRGMFQGCRSLTKLNLSNFSTDKVTDMAGMFGICVSLTEINLSGFKTDNVKNMEAMFHHCHSLTSLDLSSFATDKVTDMSDMFSYCVALEHLNLNRDSFKTDNVTDMSDMFHDCKSLRELDLSGFNMGSVVNKENMFTNAAISAEEAKLSQ